MFFVLDEIGKYSLVMCRIFTNFCKLSSITSATFQTGLERIFKLCTLKTETLVHTKSVKALSFYEFRKIVFVLLTSACNALTRIQKFRFPELDSKEDLIFER